MGHHYVVISSCSPWNPPFSRLSQTSFRSSRPSMDPGTARTKAHTPHHRLAHLWWKNDGKMHFDGEKCHLMLENLGKMRLHGGRKCTLMVRNYWLMVVHTFYVDGDFDGWVKGCWQVSLERIRHLGFSSQLAVPTTGVSSIPPTYERLWNTQPWSVTTSICISASTSSSPPWYAVMVSAKRAQCLPEKTGETDLCTYPLSKFQMEPLLKMSWEMSLPPWKMDTLRFHFAFPSVAVFHWRKPWRVLDGLDLVGPCVSLSIGILQAETGIKCSTYLNCQLQAPQQIHAWIPPFLPYLLLHTLLLSSDRFPKSHQLPPFFFSSPDLMYFAIGQVHSEGPRSAHRLQVAVHHHFRLGPRGLHDPVLNGHHCSVREGGHGFSPGHRFPCFLSRRPKKNEET